MCTSSTRKGGEEVGMVDTDNSVETIVFGNTEMHNDSLDAV